MDLGSVKAGKLRERKGVTAGKPEKRKLKGWQILSGRQEQVTVAARRPTKTKRRESGKVCGIRKRESVKVGRNKRLLYCEASRKTRKR